MSKVTSFKLTKEEMQMIEHGEKTFEEIVANKKPIDYEADLTELTKESYTALKHKGYSDSAIRKKYGVKVSELDELKASWNKAYVQKKKAENKVKENSKMVEKATSLTKELLEKHKSDGLSDKKIMEMYDLNNVQFYGLKNKWGLVGSKNKAKVISMVAHEKLQEDYEELKHEFEQFKSDTDYLRDELDYKAELIKQLNQEKDALLLKVKDLEKQSAVQNIDEKSVLASAAEKVHLSEENELLKDELQKLRVQLSEEREVHHKEVTALEKKYESLKVQHANLCESHNSLKNLLKTLNDKLSSYEKKYEKTKECLVIHLQ